MTKIEDSNLNCKGWRSRSPIWTIQGIFGILFYLTFQFQQHIINDTQTYVAKWIFYSDAMYCRFSNLTRKIVIISIFYNIQYLMWSQTTFFTRKVLPADYVFTKKKCCQTCRRHFHKKSVAILRRFTVLYII